MNGYGVSPLELMASDAMLQGLVYCDEFTYTASWIRGTATQLDAGDTKEVQIQINGDSDFVVQMRNGTFIVHGDDEGGNTCETCPNMLLTVVRAGSGREIMSGPVHVQNYLGNYWNGSYPANLPFTGLIQASNTLTLRLQNLQTDDFERVDIDFIGFKVFYVVSPQGEQGNRQRVFHAL